MKLGRDELFYGVGYQFLLIFY